MTPDPAGLGAVDPSNPQSWNRYAYVGDNSMNTADPLGLVQGLKGCGFGDPGLPCGSAALIGGCTDGSFSAGFTIPCGVTGGCNISIDGGGTVPCDMAGGLVGSSDSTVQCPQCKPGQSVGMDGNIYQYKWNEPFNVWYGTGDGGGTLTHFDGYFGLTAVGSIGAGADSYGGLDIFHCAGCPSIWRGASDVGNTALVATGAIVGANAIAIAGTSSGVVDYTAQVIGRLPDTATWRGVPFTTILNVTNWTEALNAQWIQAGIARGATFILASELTEQNLTGTVFGTEVRQLVSAGCVLAGGAFHC